MSKQLVEAMKQHARCEDWQGVVDITRGHERFVATSFDASWNLGWAFLKLGRLKEATLHLRRAVAINPEKPTGLWALGVVLLESNLASEAETVLRRSLALKDAYLTRLSLALLYMHTNRNAEAEAIHREGVALKPNSRRRIEGLANFLYDVGRTEEAASLYEQAKTLPPDD